MALLKVVSILLVASCVFAVSDVLIKRPCKQGPGAEGHNCTVLMIQNLLRDYSGGIPDLGVKALDPIYIDEIEVTEDALNFKSVFPSLRVTGFRNVIIDFISDSLEDNDTATLTYSMKFDFVAEGPIRIDFLKKQKAFVGDIKYEGGASASIVHILSKKTVHTPTRVNTIYEAGPEQITCESLHAKTTLNDELTESMQADPDVQAMKEQWANIAMDHQGRVVCAIAKEVFKAAMINIRAVARLDWL